MYSQTDSSSPFFCRLLYPPLLPVFQSPFIFLPPILSSPDNSLWVRDVLMAACHSQLSWAPHADSVSFRLWCTDTLLTSVCHCVKRGPNAAQAVEFTGCLQAAASHPSSPSDMTRMMDDHLASVMEVNMSLYHQASLTLALSGADCVCVCVVRLSREPEF